MSKQTIKVGDVVAWDAVPSGALVRDDQGDFAVRGPERGEWVFLTLDGDGWQRRDVPRWIWLDCDHGDCTIIALDVPADATAEDLRTLAERFEVQDVDVPGHTDLMVTPKSIADITGTP